MFSRALFRLFVGSIEVAANFPLPNDERESKKSMPLLSSFVAILDLCDNELIIKNTLEKLIEMCIYFNNLKWIVCW